MKSIISPRLLLTAAMFISTISYAQFIETMGNTGVSPSTIAVHASAGRFSVSTISQTGTADVRNTVPSSGYVQASGGFNVLIQAQETFMLSDIDASGCSSNDVFSFGVQKNTNASNGIDFLVLEYSINFGSGWTSIPYTALPTGVGMTGWFYRSVNLPAAACVSNLWIRFRSILVGNSSANPQFRIDDVEMTCGN